MEKKLDVNSIIKNTFKKMVEEIEKTITDTIQLQKYHETAAIAEINSVYQFVKILDNTYDHCIVYLEFPCDSGRVDAVVLLENNILLIEAKAEMTPKKFKELNGQVSRFENDFKNDKDKIIDLSNKEKWLHHYQELSLRSILKKNIVNFMEKKWQIKSDDIHVWGIILADTTKDIQVKNWQEMKISSDDTYALNVLKKYRENALIQQNSHVTNWWHLGAFTKLNSL